jgi:hypothetical protein
VTIPPGGNDDTKRECKSREEKTKVIPITVTMMALFNLYFLSFNAIIMKGIAKKTAPNCMFALSNASKILCVIDEGIKLELD